MRKLIRLSKSCIGEAEKKAVMNVLDRELLGMGAEVQKFESALKDFFERQAVCVVNGTSALHLAVQACGIGFEDEVLLPSLTYIASFQAISATNATPVACDIDPITLTLDWRDAEKRLTKKTKAIMPVHFTGGVGDLEGIYEFAKKNGLRVIEDAAHAFGSQYKGKKVGSFGDIACFSFDGIKNITSGEGGCVVSEDAAVLQRTKDARLLGVENDTEKRFNAQRSWDFDVTRQGWRYHMSNIMAAIGIEQFRRLPEFIAKRQELARYYDEQFAKSISIKTIPHNYSLISPHIYIIRIKGLKDRIKLQSRLLELGIETGVHYKPNHLLTKYKEIVKLPLTVTENVYQEILTLPLHFDLNKLDIDYICKSLLEAVS